MITTQSHLNWVIINDIVLSFVLNMKNQAQYSANILYILYFTVWGQVMFLITTACLPAIEKVLFLKVFLYCVLKMEQSVFVCVVQTTMFL